MADRTRIKICGITNEQDALAAVAAGADYLGLIFVPGTPRAVTLEQAEPIVSAMRKNAPQVQLVGVFQNQALTEVENILNVLKLDFAQLHGDEPPEYCFQLPTPVIKTLLLDLPEEALLQKMQTYKSSAMNNIHALLLDLPKGSPLTLEEAISPPLQKAVQEHPIFIAGRLQVETINAVITRFKPWGVDVASGIEERPRQKSVEKMRAFCNAVHSAAGLNQKERG
jgi:phosphoribosylanthranilate isomerase